jgi:hypothetical protein
MHVRDSVGLMRRYAHDLSYEECESWMRDLGYVSGGGKLDWTKLMKEADVKGSQYVLKSRWLNGEAPDQRVAIRDHLERAEAKRKERTPAGSRVLGLEEWFQIGMDLANEPQTFFARLHELRPLAQAARAAAEARRKAAEADAELAKANLAWTSATPATKPSRK